MGSYPTGVTVVTTTECEMFQAIDAGDHYILIEKVIGLQKSEKEPMLYYQRYAVPPGAVAK